MKAPRIETLRDGEWTAYEVTSANGYDGYSVKANADGSCTFSFIVPIEGDARTFRLAHQKKSLRDLIWIFCFISM